VGTDISSVEESSLPELILYLTFFNTLFQKVMLKCVSNSWVDGFHAVRRG